MRQAPVTAREKAIAHKIAAEQKHLEVTGVKSARLVSAALRKAYLHQLNTGELVQPRDIIFKTMFDDLVDGMITSHLFGIDRGEEMRPNKEFSLSIFSSLLKIIRRRKRMNLESLQFQYKTQALKVLNGVSAKVDKTMRKIFDDLIAQGATRTNAIKAIAEGFKTAGISPKKPYQIETLYRTQVQITYSAGRWEADKDPDTRDIHWGYKLVTVGDDRVRPNHDAMDGVTLPKEDAWWIVNFPPNGWNCRCQAISIYEPRPEVRPPKFDSEGDPVIADKGFRFNSGLVFSVA